MTRIEEDLAAAIADFPFLVTRKSNKSVETEIGEWFCQNECIVLSRKSLGPLQNFPNWMITYGFKFEEDAVAFKLKFG